MFNLPFLFKCWHGGTFARKMVYFLVLIMNLSYETPPQKMDINVTLINFKWLCETLSYHIEIAIIPNNVYYDM